MLNCWAPWWCDHRPSMTSCQSRCWSVRAAAVNPGQHYLRKEILLWKHRRSPLAASSTNTPRAPRGRWGGCGSRAGLKESGNMGQFGSGRVKHSVLVKHWALWKKNMVEHHTIRADCARGRLHHCGDVQLQVVQLLNRHIMYFSLLWRCLSVSHHLKNIPLLQALTEH